MAAFNQPPLKGTIPLKLEKRDFESPKSKTPSVEESGEPTETPDNEQIGATPPSAPKGSRKKPVIVYIMVLFIVAFLLMALSFAMHQRSNQEVLGELHSNVNALEQLQDVLDENLVLQQKVKELEAQAEKLAAEAEKLEGKANAGEDALRALQAQADALEQLYALQQQYAARDFAACKQTVAAMESSGAGQALPTDSPDDHVVSPSQRYEQLKEALDKK